MHRTHRKLFTLALTAAGTMAIPASPVQAQSAQAGQDQAIVNTFEIDWIETSDLMSPAV